jgi:D-aminopeptidase
MEADRLTVEFDEKKVEAIFGPLNQCQRPGAAVGIAIDGRPVYRKGFGLASMELQLVLTPTIRMRIGSASKHFTALAWMLLCEQERAELDAPIGTYLRELPRASGRVTARQLLTHVSGLRDAFDISWHFNGVGLRVSGEDLLAMYQTMDEVNEQPGVSWIYNNGGYLLITSAIERITGRPLDEVLREWIFAPLGMHDTTLRRWDGDFLANSATLHTLDARGEFSRTCLGTEGLGQGGIVSTVDDMLRWLSHMERPWLGSAATWNAMLSPQKLQNGASTDYALGLRRTTYRGAGVISHAGGVLGGNCQMLKVPAARLDIVIIVNRSDVFGVALADQILDACVVGLERCPPPCKLTPRSGTFRSSRTGRVVQLSVQGERQIASIDGLDMPMAPDSTGIFWAAGIQQQKNQSIRCSDQSSTPAVLWLTEFGNVDEMVRVEEPRTPNSAPTGRYVSHAAAVEADIVEAPRGSRMLTRGPHGSESYDLTGIGARLFRASLAHTAFPPGGVLSFDEEGDEFAFNSFRTRGLRFKRAVS